MKQIEAIVRPEKSSDVIAALERLGCFDSRITRVIGQGVQGGVRQMWRRADYVVDLLPKTRIVTVAEDDDVPSFLEAIIVAARTGRMGDGKIFVSTVEDATAHATPTLNAERP